MRAALLVSEATGHFAVRTWFSDLPDGWVRRVVQWRLVRDLWSLMVKFRPYSRTVLSELRRAWLRRHRRFVLTACLIVVGLISALTVWTVLFTPDSRLSWYLLGAVQATLVGLFVHGLHTGFLLNEPDGIRHLRGAWGEENTRTELETAKRRRLLWGWVDSIRLERGDLDHVVVTRRGGVVAIDSKWRNGTSTTDAEAMASAAERVRRRAEALTRQLLSSERARHRARGAAVKVRPLVVIWGAEQRRLPKEGAQVNGIDFVAGRHLRDWLSLQDSEPVSKHAAAELLAVLRSYRDLAAHGSGATRDHVKSGGLARP